MAKLDYQQVLTVMVTAAEGVLKEKWPAVKNYGQAEFEKLAKTLVQIETLRVAHKISDAEASALLEMQKNTARAVMLALEGMSLLLVEQAINAALAAVKDMVNTALGITLL